MMQNSKTPLIHLWLYNHPFNGISDQVAFFVTAFKQHGYTVSVSRRPHNSALNVVIENFSSLTKGTLREYCQSKKKRVAVIMTEHLNFDSGQILIHGDPLWSNNDYMHPATQLNRIRHLIDSLPYIRCFFVLGDLPELKNLSIMLSGIDVRTIPFPRLDLVQNNAECKSKSITSDFLFTGFMTDYRKNILTLMKTSKLSIASPEKFVSVKKRDEMNRSARLILNIPQRRKWNWLSLMRIVAALQCGRATISLGTTDNSRISTCCVQLDITKVDWMDRLGEYACQWDITYQRAFENYEAMAISFEQEKPFPHDVFEFWAITDRLETSHLQPVLKSS
jgi:hypothetical protein